MARRKKGGKEEKKQWLVSQFLSIGYFRYSFWLKKKMLDKRGLFGGSVLNNPARYMFYSSDVRKACSQTLFFLFKVRRARVTEKRGGFINHQRKGVWVGEEENRFKFFSFLAGLVLTLRAARQPEYHAFPFSLPSFPFSPETPDTQASCSHSRARRCFRKERKGK